METLRFPGNADGIEEAHDVLAAEEFAMPTGGDVEHDGGGFPPKAFVPLLLLALLAGLLIIRARRG